MTDVVRAVAVLGAFMATYYAVRLTIVYRWQHRDPRSHVRSHVMWLTLSLAMTAFLITVRLVNRLGTGEPLVPWDAALTVQIGAMLLGLQPMWAHAKRRGHRRRPEPLPRSGP